MRTCVTCGVTLESKRAVYCAPCMHSRRIDYYRRQRRLALGFEIDDPVPDIPSPAEPAPPTFAEIAERIGYRVPAPGTNGKQLPADQWERQHTPFIESTFTCLERAREREAVLRQQAEEREREEAVWRAMAVERTKRARARRAKRKKSKHTEEVWENFFKTPAAAAKWEH